jgi:hypothetical protein
LSATPIWFRVAVLVIPYLAIIMDIGSWWATKYYDPVFALRSPVAFATARSKLLRSVAWSARYVLTRAFAGRGTSRTVRLRTPCAP